MPKSLSIILIQRYILHFSQKQTVCFKTCDTVESNKYLNFTQILDIFMCVGMKTLRYPEIRPLFINLHIG